MSRLEAVIFDVDGTLAETEELHRNAFNESFSAFRLPWFWDQALYADLLRVTGGKERIRYFIDKFAAASSLTEADIAALHADKTLRYGELVAQGQLPLRTGIERLLVECQSRGLRLAIATTTTRPNVDALLAATLKSNPFEVVACGDEVPSKKPAPDIYNLALERLGVGPESCLAVEDTMNGLQSALAAGVSCLVTTSEYGGKSAFPGALAVVDQLGDPGQDAHVLAGPPVSKSMIGVCELEFWFDSHMAKDG